MVLVEDLAQLTHDLLHRPPLVALLRVPAAQARCEDGHRRQRLLREVELVVRGEGRRGVGIERWVLRDFVVVVAELPWLGLIVGESGHGPPDSQLILEADAVLACLVALVVALEML